MKKITFSLVFLILYFSFNLKAQSDDCNGYFAYKQGTKMEITVYDKKDKVSTFLRYEVFKNESSGNSTEIFFKNETLDDKEKSIVKGDFTLLCKDGQVYADVRNIVSDLVPNVSPDAEVSITGDKLIYPHNLTQGQQLPDAITDIKSGMNGITIMTVNLKITNRKVIGFETVETPAGKFDCVKITYDSEAKAGIMGTQRTSVTEYLAKGIGLVKFVSIDKKGKKVSSQLLTKLER